MERDEARALMQSKLGNKNLQKHTFAVEAIMRRLARRLGQDEEMWGLAGLLHDIDYEETKGDPAKHSLVGADDLAAMGVDARIVHAVRVHNDCHGIPRVNLMDKALHAADPLSGLIVAAVLVSPHRKLSGIDTEFVVNRFGEKSFARGASRDTIRCCSEVGLELDEFIGLALEAMQSISGDLGL
ncbi:MAG: phosphohydrolase [Firmicutes bacterium RBG_13_65_8]|nr:MAG: phosphohydrolase [Firmicutes bacterium RBG_13_65_8]